MTQSHFEDAEFVRLYAQGPSAYVPACEHMQRMTAQLIRERIGKAGEALVLGAGGGFELETLATRCPHDSLQRTPTTRLAQALVKT